VASFTLALPSQAGLFSTSKKSLLKKLRQEIAEGTASIPEVIAQVKKGTYSFQELPVEFINYQATTPTILNMGYNYRNYRVSGLTPLIYLAATAKDSLHFSLLVDLVQHPLFASLDIADSEGSTALMYAVQISNQFSSIDAVRFLLDHGAAINLKNSSDMTALMYAARWAGDSSSIDTVKLLLDHKPDVNIQSKNSGHTALMMVIIYCKGTSDARVIPLLLAQHPDLSLINKNGENVFDLAKTSGVSKLLEEASKT
jgi:hypothetical protein